MGTYHWALSQLHVAVPLTLNKQVDPANSPLQLDRFELIGYVDENSTWLVDHFTLDRHLLDLSVLMNLNFNIVHWLHLHKTEVYNQLLFDWRDIHNNDSSATTLNDSVDLLDLTDCEIDGNSEHTADPALLLLGSTPLLSVNSCICNTFGTLWYGSLNPQMTEHNAGRVKGRDQVILKANIVAVQINGQPCRKLLDSGSLSDFISTTLVNQLHLHCDMLENPLSLQLAVSGSRSKVKAMVMAQMDYQDIHENCMFHVINIDSYDMILGTLFLYQHQVLLEFNPA